MNNSVFVINTDNCYVTNKFDFNYLGPVIYRAGSVLVWINNYYIVSSYNDIFFSKSKIYIRRFYNHSKSIPVNTEILIVTSSYSIIDIYNLPPDLKVFCWFSIEPLISNINFPIGLKFLCIWKTHPSNIINKIKIPFGCELIMI